MVMPKQNSVMAKDHYARSPIYYATTKEEVDNLIENGAFVNETDDEMHTPLHYVARNNYNNTKEILKVLKQLIKNHASIHATNKEGRSPLHEASNREVVH